METNSDSEKKHLETLDRKELPRPVLMIAVVLSIIFMAFYFWLTNTPTEAFMSIIIISCIIGSAVILVEVRRNYLA